MMDPLAVLLMVTAAVCLIGAGILAEMEERADERRERDYALRLEAHGRRLRARTRDLCQPHGPVPANP